MTTTAEGTWVAVEDVPALAAGLERGKAMTIRIALAVCVAIAGCAGPSSRLTDAERELLSRIPESLRETCQAETEQGRDIPLLEGEIAVLYCYPEVGPEKVIYKAHIDAAALDRYFDALLDNYKPREGDCTQPATDHAYGPYAVNGERVGRVLCSGSPTAGLAWTIAWTDERFNVSGITTTEDGDKAALREWWMTITGVAPIIGAP